MRLNPKKSKTFIFFSISSHPRVIGISEQGHNLFLYIPRHIITYGNRQGRHERMFYDYLADDLLKYGLALFRWRLGRVQFINSM